MRILDVINKTTPFLEKNGVESPRLNIELMLAHVLQKRRLDLYLEFERELDAPTLDRLRDMVKRRVAGEPIQYITGQAEFLGLKLAVDNRVLIPRPETELLVETAADILRALALPSPVVVDVGTGSGCIAIALAKRFAGAVVWAVDISEGALEVARRNAQQHDVEKNIRFLMGDLLENLPDDVRADVMVSNPPYIATGDMTALDKEVRDFEPRSALEAGTDGLEIFRRMAAQTAGRLTPAGSLLLEIGAGQRSGVEHILSTAGFSVTNVVKDLQGHDRVMVARPRAV